MLFSVLAGLIRRTSNATEPGEHFLDALVPAIHNASNPVKVAVSEDLGLLPIDPAVRKVMQEAAAKFADLGATVDYAHPNLEGAMDVFQTSTRSRIADLGAEP